MRRIIVPASGNATDGILMTFLGFFGEARLDVLYILSVEDTGRQRDGSFAQSLKKGVK